MFKYNFKTKEVKHVLDDVELVVTNNNGVKFTCDVKKLKVIEMFENKSQLIAAPANELPEVIIETMNFSGERITGRMIIHDRSVNFSIHNEGTVMYVRKH